MKILVLNNDVVERTVIQQVLQHNGHEIMIAENSDAAMQLLQEGDIRFIIADRVTSDMDQKQFIQRVRDAQAPFYIYILLVTARAQETDITTPRGGADDYVHKPIVPLELKSRVHIGERILSLGDNLVQAKDALENTAMFDLLTGVLNQRAFLTLSRGELERARRGQAPLSLIALDIDNFEAIKQKYGENISNDVLSVIARAIREKSRPYDEIGRYEASTFLLALPGVIGQDAEKVTARILKDIQNTEITLLDGTNLAVKVSAGIVSYTRISASTEIEVLIEKASQALAQARRDAGEQIFTIFT
jgi:two-component system chemotaxis response regulator CheY